MNFRRIVSRFILILFLFLTTLGFADTESVDKNEISQGDQSQVQGNGGYIYSATIEEYVKKSPSTDKEGEKFSLWKGIQKADEWIQEHLW